MKRLGFFLEIFGFFQKDIRNGFFRELQRQHRRRCSGFQLKQKTKKSRLPTEPSDRKKTHAHLRTNLDVRFVICQLDNRHRSLIEHFDPVGCTYERERSKKNKQKCIRPLGLSTTRASLRPHIFPSSTIPRIKKISSMHTKINSQLLFLQTRLKNSHRRTLDQFRIKKIFHFVYGPSINQSINQWMNQSMDKSINQSINQWINQSMSRSINQSMGKLVRRSIN